MQTRKFVLLTCFLSVFLSGTSQITSFIGASAYSTLSKTRTSDASFAIGYGAGISYVFWENDEWFIKSGADFISRSSNIVDLPRYFDVTGDQGLVEIGQLYNQKNIVVPIAVYFIPWKKKKNAILVMGGMNIMYTIQSKYQNDTYGTHVLSADDIDHNVKVGFLLGAGYQREFSDVLFLNIFPTLNIDIRSDDPFTTFGLTLEMIYGVY